jgi:hypothetical protein
MKIKEFWVVTKPTDVSVLDDICFKSTPIGFVRQVKEGLAELDDPRFFTEEEEAILYATKLLEGRDEGQVPR